MDDDAQLVTALRRGDRHAFDLVYDRFRPRIFTFLARLAVGRIEAEDLMRETVLRLAAKARVLPGDTNLARLLFTIARNAFIDHRRRTRLDIDRLQVLSLWPSRPRHVAETPFDLSEASETVRQLETALVTLSTSCREVVLLCALEAFTAVEVASMLGDSPETVRQRLARGRKCLREALEEA